MKTILPLEITDLIINELALSCQPEAKDALHSYSLVSRTHATRVQRVTFAVIRLENNPAITRFERLLYGSSHLFAYIRELELFCDPKNTHSEQIVSILTAVSNKLHTLNLSTVHLPSFYKISDSVKCALSKIFQSPALVSLSIEGFYNVPLKYIFTRCVQLKSLDLSTSLEDKHNQRLGDKFLSPGPSTTTCALEALWVDCEYCAQTIIKISPVPHLFNTLCADMLSQSTLLTLLQGSYDSLRNLEINNGRIGPFQPIASDIFFPNLETLKLCIDFDLCFDDGNWPLCLIAALLGSHKKPSSSLPLKSVAMCFFGPTDCLLDLFEIDIWSDIDAALSQPRYTNAQLTIEMYDIAQEEILTDVRHFYTRFPRLCRLGKVKFQWNELAIMPMA